MKLRRRKKKVSDKALLEVASYYFQKGKTRLDADMLATITSYLKEGLPVATTCALSGISEQDYYNWMRWGKEFLNEKDEEERNPKHTVYGYFVLQVRLAQAKYERRVYRRSLDTEKYSANWIRDLKLLQIRMPENWAEGFHSGSSEDTYNPDEQFM